MATCLGVVRLPSGNSRRQRVKLILEFRQSIQGAIWSFLQPVDEGIMALKIFLERKGHPLRRGPIDSTVSNMLDQCRTGHSLVS